MIRNHHELVACPYGVATHLEQSCDFYGFAVLRSVAKSLAKDLVSGLLDDDCPGDESPLRVTVCVRADDANPVTPAWVAVSERVPSDGVRVLVYMPNDGYGHPRMVAAYYSSRYGWAMTPADFCGNDAITHWMPLPPPPRETTP